MTPAFTRKRDTWLHRVGTADAVLMQPLPPIDPLDAAIVLGNIFGSQLEPALAQRVVAAAALIPDSEELP